MANDRKPEFHLYLYPLGTCQNDVINAYTLNQISKLVDEKRDVDTYQVMGCITSLFREGYRVFVHPDNDHTYEITLGTCECFGGRELRMGHNLPYIIVATF